MNLTITNMCIDASVDNMLGRRQFINVCLIFLGLVKHLSCWGSREVGDGDGGGEKGGGQLWEFIR